MNDTSEENFFGVDGQFMLVKCQIKSVVIHHSLPSI